MIKIKKCKASKKLFVAQGQYYKDKLEILRGKALNEWQEQEEQEEEWANSVIPVHVPRSPTSEDRHELHQREQQEWQEQHCGKWANSSEFVTATTSTSRQDNLHNANNATYYSTNRPIFSMA